MPRCLRWRSALAFLAIPAGVAIRRLLLAADNDRAAALAAGAVLGLSLYLAVGLLDLPLLSPPMLYLCVFALFHLGMALPWAMGIYDEKLPWWFVSNKLTPALALVELATAAYLAGLLLASRPGSLPPPCATVYTNDFFFACGVAIYLAGCAMFFLGVSSLGGARFFDAGYAATYRLQAEFDPRLFGTSFTVVPIGLYLAAASFPRRRMPVVLGLTLVWMAGVFILGFRGFALIPGLVVLGLLDQRGFRAPRWVNLAVALAVLLAIPMARAIRDHGLGQRSLEAAWSQIDPLNGVVEMGGSLRPLVHTLLYLDGEPWRWGRTYWQSLGTVWPNLAQTWDGGRYIPLQDLPPNHWLTVQADPEMYRNHGGLGFSAVAEPYMNFGAPGVLLYFCCLGAVLARTAASRSTRPLPLAASAMVLGPLLWTTRNSFEIFFRPAAWGLLAVLGVRLASAVARKPAAGALIRFSHRRAPAHARISG